MEFRSGDIVQFHKPLSKYHARKLQEGGCYIVRNIFGKLNLCLEWCENDYTLRKIVKTKLDGLPAHIIVGADYPSKPITNAARYKHGDIIRLNKPVHDDGYLIKVKQARYVVREVDVGKLAVFLEYGARDKPKKAYMRGLLTDFITSGNIKEV